MPRKKLSKEHKRKISEALKGREPHNKEDLSGQKFNRLFVSKKIYIKNKKTYYECLCDCGNIKHIRSDVLTSGTTMSCGCLQKELSSERCKNNIGEKAPNYKDGRCSDGRWKIIRKEKEKAIMAKQPVLTKIEKKLLRQLYKIRDLLNYNSIDFHIDHIKPLSKGGLHHPNNLQILPAWLNLEKNNKWPLTIKEQVRYKGIKI